MIVVTPDQMKYMEAMADTHGNSYENLMEQAGKKLSERIYEILKEKNNKNILFLCGSGNNAGDCFVAARYLCEKNIFCTVAMLQGEPKTAISKLNFSKIDKAEILYDKEIIKNKIRSGCFELIADGVFGTGFHGEIPEDIRKIFNECKNLKIIAADVPSGGNCKTGAVSKGTLKAFETVTFGYEKFGMTQYPLKSFCGNINIAQIGISESFADGLDFIIKKTDFNYAHSIIPKKMPDAHKGNFGRLLLVCGSENMPGACIMAAEAAAKSGVGLLEVSSARGIMPIIASRLPEAMLCPLETDSEGYINYEENYEKIIERSKKASAVLIGCGFGVTENTKKLVRKIVCDIDRPIIIDADGINCITDGIDIIKRKRSGIILTPHPAEMGRLCNKNTSEIQQDRLAAALDFSRKYNAVTVLKGAGTVIAKPDKVLVNQNGNPGMAKGGSGDVLSGIIASLTAQGIKPFDSAALGVFVHGLAGDIAAEKLSMQSMTATDIIKNLSEAFKMIME